jgi:lysozyme
MEKFRDVPLEAERIVQHFESCRLEAYHDAVGFPTIGWGHLLSRTRWEPLEKYPAISQEEADELLRRDLAAMGLSVCKLCPVPLSDLQYAALISFTFNVGSGNLQVSSLRQKLLRGEYLNAANEFPKWVYAGGQILRGLKRRRAAEQQLFLAGTNES